MTDVTDLQLARLTAAIEEHATQLGALMSAAELSLSEALVLFRELRDLKDLRALVVARMGKDAREPVHPGNGHQFR